MPKISVIIPTYNRANLIGNAIDSVLKQSYQDFEIIIVDDGSSDKTKEIVHLFQLKHSDKIKYFYQDNKGPGNARNVGISNSRARYVAFLDADDVMFKDSLLSRVSFLDACRDISLVFTDYIIGEKLTTTIPVLKHKRFLSIFKSLVEANNNEEYIFKREFYYKYLLFRPYAIWTGTVMIKKEIINDIGLFRTDISISEDTDFWMRILEKYKAGFINKPTATYNIGIANSISKKTEERYLDTMKQLTVIHDDKNNKLSKSLINRKIATAHLDLGYYYFSNYKIVLARRHFLLSISRLPLSCKPYIYLIVSLIPIPAIQKLKNVKQLLETNLIHAKS